MFDIQEELKKLPGKPGVYLMHDETDKIIYVGKAISLKNRVRHERTGAVPDGRPAAGRRTARPGPGSRSRRLDLQLRPDRQHRQILCQLRQPQACPGTCSRQLGMQLRHLQHR